MSTNIFFSNGFVSALASCFIADYLRVSNPDEESFIIIEQNTHVDPAYYHVLDLLIQQSRSFKKVIKVSSDFRVLNPRNPCQYFADIKHYRNIAGIPLSHLDGGILRDTSTIWAPRTSMLWPFFRKGNMRIRGIEHGIGEYISAATPSNRRVATYLLRRALDKVTGYSIHAAHESLWLCSDAVTNFRHANIVQFNFASEFITYAQMFWEQYQTQFPDAARELTSIREQLIRHGENAYLYLPSDEIQHHCYSEFINGQMTELRISDAPLFIIKRHPGDVVTQYQQLLSRYGSCIVISKLENCYLPAEFVSFILDIRQVIGSCSSTLFYLRSWQPNIKLRIYNDYDATLLKPEWAELPSSLASVGLINRLEKNV